MRARRKALLLVAALLAAAGESRRAACFVPVCTRPAALARRPSAAHALARAGARQRSRAPRSASTGAALVRDRVLRADATRRRRDFADGDGFAYVASFLPADEFAAAREACCPHSSSRPTRLRIVRNAISIWDR